VLPEKLPSPEYVAVTVYGDPALVSPELSAQVAAPDESDTVSPPSQVTVVPDESSPEESDTENVTFPVGEFAAPLGPNT